jgi:hypothetical protein
MMVPVVAVFVVVSCVPMPIVTVSARAARALVPIAAVPVYAFAVLASPCLTSLAADVLRVLR